ncbi:MAG: AAA family ATPase [Syntrophales bacterium]
MRPPVSMNYVQKLVEDQVRKWNQMNRERPQQVSPVITISRELGSGGTELAKALAERLKLDLYGSRIIDEVAKSSKMSATVIGTLDEKGRSMLDDWISILEKERNIWGYEYLRHLVKVIGTIGKHGRAVILGRGAHLILPKEDIFRVRVIAPMDVKIKNIKKELKISTEEARKRIISVESEREAFIHKYFHQDIEDASQYDLIINTGYIDPVCAASVVIAALYVSRKMARHIAVIKPTLTELFR